MAWNTRRPKLGRPPGANAADTRERILRVAQAVFSEVGYDATTFRAVAVRAGLTRPAINHYFSGKNLLYQAVLERVIRLNVDPAIERARAKSGLLAQLSSFITDLEAVSVADRSVSVFLATAIVEANRHPELLPAVVEAQRGTREFFVWAVTGAVGRGELIPHANVLSLVDTLAAVLWGMAFYAAFVDNGKRFSAVSANMHLLLVDELRKFTA